MDGWIARDASGYLLFVGPSRPVLIEDPGGEWWVRGSDDEATKSDEPLFGIAVEMHQCVPVLLSAQLTKFAS